MAESLFDNRRGGERACGNQVDDGGTAWVIRGSQRPGPRKNRALQGRADASASTRIGAGASARTGAGAGARIGAGASARVGVGTNASARVGAAGAARATRTAAAGRPGARIGGGR